MKDTTITAKRKKIELVYMLVSFLLSNILNIIAIAIYKANYTEIITSFFYVLAFSFVIYFLTVVIRLIIACAVSILKRKK